jgi:glycosyltransferase involved in cell wall biosynthesis
MDFSIVTPTFKQPEWVRLCANSVLDQTGVSFEHIIQEAGGESELEWLADDKRVAVHVEKDSGMYDGLCKGIAKAAGSIIAHLNSDEQYLPGTLAKVKAFFDANPDVDVLFGDAILVDANGELLSYRRIVKPFRSHIISCHLCTLTCSAFFRRDLVDRGLSYTNEWRMIGDSALVLSWMDAGVRMATMHEPLAIFTFTGANLSTGEEAAGEGVRFRAQHPLSFPVNYRIFEIYHRLKKFLAGAYAKQEVDIEIYTLASPRQRVRKSADHVSFSWPRGAVRCM